MTQQLDETKEVRETRSALLPQESLIAMGLPPYCYAAHPSSGELIMIRRGQMGFTTSPFKVAQTVDELNAIIGVDDAQREAMLSGSIFGFHVPGADPRMYRK
jgi:hypothetical protein